MKTLYKKFMSLFKTQKVEDEPYYLSYENGGVLVLQKPVAQDRENVTSKYFSLVHKTGGAL